MTLCKGRPLAARLARLDLEQTLWAGLADEQEHSPGDGEIFRLSVQFASAHGVPPVASSCEITTLSSSALLSGAGVR